MPPKPRPLWIRFFENLEIASDDECWLYGGTIRKTDGYGVIRDEAGVLQRAHRVSFFLFNGYAPPEVCHRCDTPACCNAVKCLFDGTHAENMADSWSKGRAGGPPVENAVKLVCDHGHPFTPENTYERPDRPGTRECRACRVERTAAWRRRNPEIVREWDRAQKRKRRATTRADRSRG